MIKRLLPFIAFLGLAVLLGVGVMMNSGKDTSASPSPLVGKPAPDVGQALHYVQQVRRYYDAIALNTSVQREATRVAALDFDISTTTALR